MMEVWFGMMKGGLRNPVFPIGVLGPSCLSMLALSQWCDMKTTGISPSTAFFKNSDQMPDQCLIYTFFHV